MDYIENPEPEEIEQVKSKILCKMDLCAKACAQELRTPDISKLHFDKLTYDELCMLCSCCEAYPLKEKLCFLKARLGIGVGQMKLFHVIHSDYDENFLALTMPTFVNENGYSELVRYFGEFGFGTGEKSKRFDSPMSLCKFNKVPKDTVTIAFKLVHNPNEMKSLDRLAYELCHDFGDFIVMERLPQWIDSFKHVNNDGWYDDVKPWFDYETNMEHWFMHGLQEFVGRVFGGSALNKQLMSDISATVACIGERAKCFDTDTYGKEDYMLSLNR